MTDQQKKIAAGAAFGLLAVLILSYELYDPTPHTTVQAPAAAVSAPLTPSGSSGTAGSSGGTAKRLGTTAAELDPSLHMRAMLTTESLAYSGSGRNIFSATSVVAAPMPRPIAPARPLIPVIQPGPVGPPPPPPIQLTFFGTATSAKTGQRAFLLKGEDVFLASTGDVVQRRYKVISIATNSIVIEDLTDNHQQTLPLLKN